MPPYLAPLRFCLQLLLAESVFLICYPRRKNFWFGALFLVLVPLCIGIAMNYAMENAVDILRVIFVFPVVFMLTLVGIYFTFSVNKKEILFAGVGGYILQHISFNISRILLFYFADATGAAGEWILFHIMPHIVLDALAFVLFVRPMMKRGELKAKDSRLIILSLVFLIIAVVISGMIQDGDTFLSQVICRLYAIACCTVLWFFMFGLFQTGKLESEKTVLEHCLVKDAERGRIAQQTDEMISLKFHDLKHQLRELKEIDNYELRQKTIESLEKTVTSYSEIAKTGNKALDILLGEKITFCNNNAIRLDYNADGALLSFMDFTDIYSFFGNAIDNAIESLLREEDEKKRTVSVEVRNRQGVVFVGIYNYCSGQVRFSDGLPVTSKEDKNLHGYGVKSMRHIAGKYGGELTLTLRDDTFCCEAIFMNVLHK